MSRRRAGGLLPARRVASAPPEFKTDAEAKAFADGLKSPPLACTAWAITFGGRCLNCGGVGSAESRHLRTFHAPQPERDSARGAK